MLSTKVDLCFVFCNILLAESALRCWDHRCGLCRHDIVSEGIVINKEEFPNLLCQRRPSPEPKPSNFARRIALVDESTDSASPGGQGLTSWNF